MKILSLNLLKLHPQIQPIRFHQNPSPCNIHWIFIDGLQQPNKKMFKLLFFFFDWCSTLSFPIKFKHIVTLNLIILRKKNLVYVY